MFALIVQLATSLRAVLAYAPSNRLAWRLCARGGLGSALAAMTAGGAYLFAAATCTVLLDRGGPGWLNVLVLLFICYAAIVVMPMLAARRRSAVVGGLCLSA